MGHAEFTLRNQPAQKPLSLDEYWMPFTPNRDFKADPKIVVRAEGMYYWNDRGEKIIDASSGLFCVAAGHGRKEIADAVHRAAARARFRRAVPARASEELRARLARRRAHARRPEPHLLRQLGLRGGRHRDEGRARLPPGARAGRAARCSSRASARITASISAASRCRASSTTGASSAPASPGVAHMRHTHLKENLLHAGRRRARRRPRRRPAAVRQPLRRREHRRLLRRADRRIDRLPRAAEGLSAAAARDLRHARHPARVRRGDHRLRPHRPAVRRAELRRDARHHDDGQGASPTARSRWAPSRFQRAHPRHDHGRGAGRRDRVLPRLYVLGPSRPRAPRGSRRSTSTATKACSSARRELSPYFLDACSRCADVAIVTDIRGYGMLAAFDLESDGMPGRRGHVLQKKLFDNGLNLTSAKSSVNAAPRVSRVLRGGGFDRLDRRRATVEPVESGGQPSRSSRSPFMQWSTTGRTVSKVHSLGLPGVQASPRTCLVIRSTSASSPVIVLEFS